MTQELKSGARKHDEPTTAAAHVQPKTALPWKYSGHDIHAVSGWSRVVVSATIAYGDAELDVCDEDATYIVHACNAYPKLVEALRKITAEVGGMLSLAELDMRAAVGNTNVACLQLREKEALAILRELGELDATEAKHSAGQSENAEAK